jgi:hypothetical protein
MVTAQHNIQEYYHKIMADNWTECGPFSLHLSFNRGPSLVKLNRFMVYRRYLLAIATLEFRRFRFLPSAA